MKKNVYYFIIPVSMILVLVLLFNVISNFGTSYAINIGIDKSGIPTETFTSDVTNDDMVNYVEDAFTANGQSNPYTPVFNVKLIKSDIDNVTPLYSLMKNLESPKMSEQFEILDDNPVDVTDKGLLYILGHGYNASSSNNIFSTGTYGSVTDNDIKQYVTQVALWLYIYENNANFASTYCADNACQFLNPSNKVSLPASNLRNVIKTGASSENYKYLNYITALVDNAKLYTGSQTSKISSATGNMSYQINDDFSLLVTDAISVAVDSNQNNYLYYSVEIDDPNGYGVYITDINGDRLSNTNIMSGSFKVAVPLQENIAEMDLSSITIKVYGHFLSDNAYDYRVTATTSESTLLNKDKTQRFTNVLLGYMPNEVVGTSFKLVNFVKVSKVDITNSTELPGATLEITNKADDTKKETWVSSDKPHYLYLENGDYQLCETIAPEGYDLATECIDFTVDGSNIVSVQMENKPTEVPDTGMFSSKTLYYIGTVLVLVGLAGITVVVTKKKKVNI